MRAFKTLLLTGLAGSALLASAANAQDKEPSPVPDANDGPSEAGAIVVTGSRIARPELESAMPVNVTRMDEAFRLGRVTAYDALKLDPALGVGLNLGTYQSVSCCDGGVNAGISSVNLRNLGTSRTLTLINGQRRVSAGASSSEVDINAIPVGMIDRIEVVTGGAAAVYGSDAVTGAVNIITKREIDGLNITATNGISSRGDASEFMVSVSTGGKFADDRGSFVIGGTYSNTAPLQMNERRSESLGFPLYFANPKNTEPNDGIPDNIIYKYGKQLYLHSIPNYYLGGKHYLVENGAIREAVCAGAALLSGALQLCDGNATDGRQASSEEQIRGGLKSLSSMAHVGYNITDAIEYGADISYSQTKFHGFGHYWHDDSRSVYYGGAGGSIAYLDNPYLPVAARQQMIDAGVTKVNVDRSFTNFPIEQQRIDRESFTIGQSLGGPLTDKLKWQAFWQYGILRWCRFSGQGVKLLPT